MPDQLNLLIECPLGFRECLFVRLHPGQVALVDQLLEFVLRLLHVVRPICWQPLQQGADERRQAPIVVEQPRL